MKIRENSGIAKYYIQKYDEAKDEYYNIVSNYIQYYDHRATRSKWEYYILNTVRLLAIASVPVVQVLDQQSAYTWVVVAVSSLCLFLESIMGLVKIKDKWILYRKTNNVLMSKQRNYAVEYQMAASDQQLLFRQFVIDVEEIIDEEARKWSETVMRKEESPATEAGNEKE